MSKELEALEKIELHDFNFHNGCFVDEIKAIRKALEEHEMLKNLVVKMFGENGLDFETWKHFDKSQTYHIVYTNSYEHLDIPISKEEYDFIGDLYGKDRVGD